ncbi:MAG: putative helicase like protein, partial [Pseudomonadota bacterium]
RPNFTILDADDQVRLLKQILAAENIDDKKWPARVLMAVIQRWKDRGLAPEQVTAGEDSEVANGRSLAIYRQYQERLRTINAADFGDLLLECIRLFRENPEVLRQYQQRFKFILVDEYQDTNVAQYLWLRLLAQTRKNICCVGDDDQSIYSWRGAEVANILRFEKDFPDAVVIRLEQNYRSTPHILAAASGLIAHNGGRLGKTLWTTRNAGDKVRVIGVWDGPEEARRVSDDLESLERRGTSLDAAAILVRAQFQTREFEDRFISIGMAYRIIGGFRFYERAEIRDALAYLRLVYSPADDLAFERIVNTPKRGLGDKAIARIHQLARAQQSSLLTAATTIVATDELTPQARRSLVSFVDQVARWRDAASTMGPSALAQQIIEESGYTAMLQADRSAEAAGRLENLSELARAMDEYESMEAFLEHVSLVMDRDNEGDQDKVTIMTIHAAKGLEFEHVFLVGWEDGVFPSQRALDEGGTAALEEERRLAYVAITRARTQATIFHAANRRIYGQWTSSIPSRFIAEIPVENVDSETSFAGGASLWRANWGAQADPFAHVAVDAGRTRTRGPGFQRAVTSSGLRPASTPPVEGRATSTTVGAKARRDIAVGMRVFHEKFGYGAIVDIDGNKLEIAFEQAGSKRVLDSFIRIEK